MRIGQLQCFLLTISIIHANQYRHHHHGMKLRCFQCNMPYHCESGSCYGDLCVKTSASDRYVVKGCENITRSVSADIYEPHMKHKSFCRTEAVLGVETTICYCRDEIQPASMNFLTHRATYQQPFYHQSPVLSPPPPPQYSNVGYGVVQRKRSQDTITAFGPPAVAISKQAVNHSIPALSIFSGQNTMNRCSQYFDGKASIALNNSSSVIINSTPTAIPRHILTEKYARKVFVGGLPIDVTEAEVYRTFSAFGNVYVDWPRRENNRDGTSVRQVTRQMCGYAFLVYEEEAAVHRMIQKCAQKNDRLYLYVTSVTMKNKPVQVRPWKHSDTEYILDPNIQLDGRRTVFIGGVPRPTRAVDLANGLSELYGKVAYVGIDIDPELKYPKGAARVVFASTEAHVAALNGRYVHVDHTECNKRVEIKPYVMDEQFCDECDGKMCHMRYAPYFCGESGCMQYYCENCWDRVHARGSKRADHCVLVRIGDQTKLLRTPPHHNARSSAYKFG